MTGFPPLAPPGFRTVWAHLALAGAVLAWASAFIVLRALSDQLTPGALALGRLAVAAVVLVPLALVSGSRLPRRWAAVWPVLAYGIAWFGIYSVLIAWAGHHLDAGTSALLVNFAPVLVALHAVLIGRERPSASIGIGIAVALSGTAVIALGSHRAVAETATVSALGVGLGLACAVLYAAGIVLQGRAIRRGVSPLAATTVGSVVGLVTCLPFAGQLADAIGSMTTPDLLAVVWLGAVSTAGGFALFAAAQKQLPTTLVASSSYLVPAVVIILGWLLLAELPTPWAILGGSLCLLGVAITRRRTRRGPTAGAARPGPTGNDPAGNGAAGNGPAGNDPAGTDLAGDDPARNGHRARTDHRADCAAPE